MPSVWNQRAVEALVVGLGLLLVVGCGGASQPSPRPTPEGQSPPGLPDANGLPSPPGKAKAS